MKTALAHIGTQSHLIFQVRVCTWNRKWIFPLSYEPHLEQRMYLSECLVYLYLGS